jgi:CPA2 family monovalent cation:H+ antiporter-2
MHGLLFNIVLLLALTVIIVAVFRRLHLPPILGYLAIGMLVGPYALGWVDNEANIHFMAELGIVFLMFAIGLEFSMAQVFAMRKLVLGLGGLQVILTTLVLGGIVYAISPLGLEVSFLLGAALSLSSTAVVTKQLTEQQQLHSRHGRAALGVLIFQDIAAIPLLILIPALAGLSASGMGLGAELGFALLKGIAAVAIMLLAGRYILRPLFHEIASAKSPELFTLTVLLVTLLAAAVTNELGLSMALGAFIAGMMLGETEYRHQIESDIRPFQDVLLGLFFITVGMLIDFNAVTTHLMLILALTLALMIIKTAIVIGLTALFAYPMGVAIRNGVVLGHAGEFGFALISLAFGLKVLGEETTQIALAVAVISMAISPLLIRFNGQIARKFSGSYKQEREQEAEKIEQMTQRLTDHAIICGFGRVGQNVARFLEESSIPFIAFDLDPKRVSEAAYGGELVFYADSSRQDVLHAAQIQHAKFVVISFAEIPMALKIIAAIRQLRRDIPILVRTRDDTHLTELLDAGATEVIPEILEASLMMASHALLLGGVPAPKVLKKVVTVRRGRYQMLHSVYTGSLENYELGQENQPQAMSLTIAAACHAINKRLDELPFAEMGIEIIAIRRDGIRGTTPAPDTLLREGDILSISGAPDQLEKLEAALCTS